MTTYQRDMTNVNLFGANHTKRQGNYENICKGNLENQRLRAKD